MSQRVGKIFPGMGCFFQPAPHVEFGNAPFHCMCLIGWGATCTWHSHWSYMALHVCVPFPFTRIYAVRFNGHELRLLTDSWLLGGWLLKMGKNQVALTNQDGVCARSCACLKCGYNVDIWDSGYDLYLWLCVCKGRRGQKLLFHASYPAKVHWSDWHWEGSDVLALHDDAAFSRINCLSLFSLGDHWSHVQVQLGVIYNPDWWPTTRVNL